jgi:(1->4)-alpha-D-glucan 1-alpha-D-glucosylmutase
VTASALPESTYRLQISSAFTLDDAAALCDYLHTLGVGWVYLSPVLRAQPGSAHGYDVIDHSLIDPERGGNAAFTRFCARAHHCGLGVLVDIVPNHMGVETPSDNPWWWDLLTHGRSSRFADAFDVDWDAAGGRIRLPVLGDDPAELDHLVIDGDQLAYYDHRFPILPGTVTPGDTAEQVHARQSYELISWRRADAELNYRRFFAVNSLAGIRVEEPWVFEKSHALIGDWFRLNLVDGLRVDHPDGLADPRGYLDDLAELTSNAPVWVEKILEGDEVLPENWAVHGTTGYDALGDFDRVLVDANGQAGLQHAQRAVGGSGEPDPWPELIQNTKRGVADGILRSEVNRLGRLMPEIPDADNALIDLLAAFGVYRSYLPLGADRLAAAAADARARHPEHASAIDAVARILALPEHPATTRFQQTSGMVMAKGVEDTAFYRYGTLTSLNEVGADPSEFSIDVQRFHDRQATRQAALPRSLTALSTHDTKRGEDTRARITALAERPGLWESTLSRLHRAADLDNPVLENLLWQAVIGAWPASRDRLHGYAEKAARESGTSTNWITPDTAFETRMHAAIDAAFDDENIACAITELVDAIAPAGYANGLSMKLLQLTAPGIPDVYQGSELWETSLVDPDNRRPVDFAARIELLRRIDAGWLPPIDGGGAAKLLLVARALRLRLHHPRRFSRYIPLTVFGPSARHAVAFDRGGAVTIATRLPYTLERDGGWQHTWIEPAGRNLIDVLTGREFAGGRIRLTDVLGRYPVALLTAREGLRGRS